MRIRNASLTPVRIRIDADNELTMKEAAAIAHCSAGLIYNWAREGHFIIWSVKRHQYSSK
jgi:hypothetical protein